MRQAHTFFLHQTAGTRYGLSYFSPLELFGRLMSVVLIDDNSAPVAYSGDWESTTSYQRALFQTVHFAKSRYSAATLTFTGISVEVVGFVMLGTTTQASYSLDGGPATVRNFTAIGPFPFQRPSLYVSPMLRNGQHTLTITSLSDSDPPDVILDYFNVTTGGTSTSPSSLEVISSTISLSMSSTRPATSSTSVSRNETNSSSLSVSATRTAPSSFGSESASALDGVPPARTPQSGNIDANSAKSHHTAAIIGAISALAIFVFFSIVGLWLLRRRRKQKESESWIFSTLPGGTATTTPLPAVMPQMNEQPQFPPSYARSEPPAYDAGIGPAPQVMSPPEVLSFYPATKLEFQDQMNTRDQLEDAVPAGDCRASCPPTGE